jgi:hypothetical protein
VSDSRAYSYRSTGEGIILPTIRVLQASRGGVDEMQKDSKWPRIVIIALCLWGGFFFPLLFIPAAAIAWTFFLDPNRTEAEPEQRKFGLGLRHLWNITSDHPEWKRSYRECCESPAEIAFLEAMISSYGLLPYGGVLKGSGLTLARTSHQRLV